MHNLESPPRRACCAPLPREINNYYSRNHSKKKDKSDCKGSCYCNSLRCDGCQKGLKGQFDKANICNCCKQHPKPENFANQKKICSKCKKPKRQRATSPNNIKKNDACRCCSPQRCTLDKQYSNGCKCKKDKTNFNQDQNSQLNMVNKKYILCYKQYEEGDSMLESPTGDETIQENCPRNGRQPGANCFNEWFKNSNRVCCENNQRNSRNVRGANTKEQQQKNIICTCGLLTPCECELEGLWSQGGGAKDAAPPCRRCGEKVYAAEKLIASGGAFHTSCFSCYGCHKALEVTNLYESQGEIYCKQCYAKYFGMSGYGYGTTLLSPV